MGSGDVMEMMGKLLIAALLGGIVGLERDVHGRAAGLRTHILVSVGAALFMLLSLIVSGIGASGAPAATGIRADPGRIAAQVVTGIGFLGAGTIIKSGFTVRGLTTASCLWVVAAVGMAVGAGAYSAAFAATAIAVVALVVLNYAETLYRKDDYRRMVLRTAVGTDLALLRNTIERKYVRILGLSYACDFERGEMEVVASLRIFQRGASDDKLSAITADLKHADPGLKFIEWQQR